MTRKYSEDENLKLIKLYRLNDCLWDIQSQNYSNKQMRTAALLNISREMNIEGQNVAEVKKKIKSLRATYYLELDKIEKSLRAGSQSKVYTPKVKWFEEIHAFIRNVTIKRKATISIRGVQLASTAFINMDRWSSDRTMHFVQEYMKHPCLWDVRDSSYKNKQLRLKAYMTIASNVGLQGYGYSEIAQKIKNIRSTYSQELKKIRCSKLSGAKKAVYVPNMKWFAVINEKLSGNSDSRDSDTYMNCNNQQSQQSNSTFSSVYIKPPKRKMMTETHNVQRIQETNSTNVSNNDTSENEFDIFGRLIAVQLKALPFAMALEAQQHIQTYLSRHRLKQYRLDSDNEHQDFLVEDIPHSSPSPDDLECTVVKEEQLNHLEQGFSE